MNIKENKLVSLSYQLTVDGAVVDSAPADRPLQFIFGMGMLLPEFESNVVGKTIGDKFAFTLTPEQGYGAINPDAVVEIPKEIFMVDGAIADDLLVVGNVLPMGDNQGNRMNGTIKVIGESTVTMDFNHPMAGKVLNFEGEVVAVAEASEEDMAQFFGNETGGCSCGSGGCGDESCGSGGCGDESCESGGCGEGGCGEGGCNC